MLGSMLVGLDGTDDGRAAGAWAIARARETGAVAVGVGIVDEPGIRAVEPAYPVGGKPGVDPVFYVGYDVQMARVRTQAEERLRQFSSRCAEADVKHSTQVLVGAPAPLLIHEEPAYDLVVLGRETRFRFTTHDHPDGTAEEVLEGGPRPVVVVPRGEPRRGPVVFAYDGGPHSSHALAVLEASGLAFGREIEVFCVGSNLADADEHVRRAVQFLKFHEIEARGHPLASSRPPAELILEEVDRNEAQLLVMGACGRPTLRERLLGTVTRAVLRESPVPLFLSH